MARAIYIPEDFGQEVVAPSGYYLPVGERFLDHQGRRLLYVTGSYCVETSCCGKGSWDYLRVEGYVVEEPEISPPGHPGPLEIETVEDDAERAAITRLLQEEHPQARIEFR